MPFQNIAIGALFALSLVTLALATATRAEEPQRSFVARSLTPAPAGPDFGLAPETWSRSLHDLAEMLARVRNAGTFHSAPRDRLTLRTVTLAEAAQAQQWRRQVVEELELSFP